MNNDMFPRLFPVGVSFFNGESPSPQKLAGVFNYIQAAFYVLEGFLGNGVDYQNASSPDRRMLYNVSAAIGHMSKLYKPSNKLTNLEFLYRNYAKLSSELVQDNNAYIQADGESSLVVSSSTNIPVRMTLDADHRFGFDAIGTGTVKLMSDGVTVATFNVTDDNKVNGLSIQKHYTIVLLKGSRIDYISIDVNPQIELFTMYLVDANETIAQNNRPYNIGYALDPASPMMWKALRPCQHAVNGTCLARTGSYCIGNTYDVFTRVTNKVPLGEPVCGGNFTATIEAGLIPKNAGGDTLAYTADTSNNTASTLTIQSPLMVVERPYGVKFSPYAVHNLSANTIIPQNEVAIYDKSSDATSTVKYNLTVQSAGRPDIVFVNDTTGELGPGNDRLVVLGGLYGMSDMLYDLAKGMIANPQPSTSVYAE